MRIEIPSLPETERTPLVQSLLAALDLQQPRIAQLEELVGQLRDEIAVLKGHKPRPTFAPSRLEAPAPPAHGPGDRRPGSDKRPRNAQLVIHDERFLDAPDAPPGCVRKGYEPFVVQDLRIEAKVTRYWRQRLRAPDGRTLLAPLPPGLRPGCHLGPELIAYLLSRHHHCGVTQPLLREQLREMGPDLSAGQVHRLLTEGTEAFHAEKAELLPAGLAVSSYVGVDDTPARHRGRNGTCTAISNDLFASFASTDSKSRLNFLRLLRGASGAYVIDEVARAYWQRQGLPQEWQQKLGAGPLCFADEAAWQARLAALGLGAERPVRVATEGALLGGLVGQGVAPDLVILSAGAGQFGVLAHAACRVHAERPLARLVPPGEAHREAIAFVRAQIRGLYEDLKLYQQLARCQPQPDLSSRRALEYRFDCLVGQPTGFPSIGQVLQEMRQHKADLLRVLERPEVPLHNNGTERDIREYVKKRKIGGGTRSAAGRRCRDTFSSLKKTCRKLGVRFWSYLRDRLGGLGQIPRLAELIRRRAGEKTAGRAEAVLA
jgi:hypothetical protein